MEDVKKEKRTPLVKGIKLSIEDKARNIVKKGYADPAKAEDDAIRGEIFNLGIGFGKVTSLFNALLKDMGLVVDVKQVKKDIVERIAGSKLTFSETWDELKTLSDAICGDVEGSSQTRVFAELKKHFELNEYSLPKKIKTKRGKIGLINRTIIEVFKANPKAKPSELEAALTKVAKSPKNAADYTKSMYTMGFALANGIDTETALKEVEKVYASDVVVKLDPTMPDQAAEKDKEV